MENKAKSMSSTVGRAFSSIGSMASKAFSTVTKYTKYAVAGLIGIGTAATKMAMDVQESENLFEVSMGNMASATRKWSNELSDALYLNQYEVRRNVATLNVMLSSMGLTEQAAADMSKRLTELTYDMSSFYNLKPEEAFQKLQAGISGEAEPLKRLGILINETTIKAYAMSHGIGDATGQLTEQQKVMARYGAILEATQKAQGDLQRTLDSGTNIFRSTKALIIENAVAFGQALLPKVQEYATKARDWLKENKDVIQNWADTFANRVVNVSEKLIELGKFLVEHRKWVVATVAAYAGFSVLHIIIGSFKLLTSAVYGASIAYGVLASSMALVSGFVTVSGAVAMVTKRFIGMGYGAANAATQAKVLVKDLGLGRLAMLHVGDAVHSLKRKLTQLPPVYSKIGVAASAAFTTYEVVKLIGKVKEYLEVLRDVNKTLDKQQDILDRARERRFENYAKMQTFPEIEAWKIPEKIDFSKMRDPSKTVNQLNNQQKADVVNTTESITDAYRDMYGQMGRMSDRVYLAEQENLTNLAMKYQEVTQDNLTVAMWYNEQRRKLDIERLESSNSVINGIKAAGMKMKDEIKSWGEIASETWYSMQTSFGNAMSSMFLDAKTGTEAIKGFLSDIGRAFVNLMTQQAALQLFSGLGFTAATAHTGGTVGSLTNQKEVSPLVFANAPRMHDGGIVGLKSNERPIIAEVGESIYKKGQGPNVVNTISVKLENKSGVDLDIKKTSQSPDETVISIVRKDIQRGGGIAQDIQSMPR